MNTLIIGIGGKGSMTVRGHQLGQAIGARILQRPSTADLEWADLIVLIKRTGLEWAQRVRLLKKPIVWDALDFWQQPEENGLSEPEARALFIKAIEMIRPTLVIGATEAMASACGGVYLPHHAWPNLLQTAARPTVWTVGYQGKKKYLGRWAKAVAAECARRDWRFAVNPPDLRQCDLLVAFRDGQWDGWMCQEWKSGVKVVNAMAAGRPIITQPSAAFRELKPAGMTIQHPDELAKAFDVWGSFEARQQAAQSKAAEPFSLSAIAMTYRRLLAQTFARVRAA